VRSVGEPAPIIKIEIQVVDPTDHSFPSHFQFSVEGNTRLEWRGSDDVSAGKVRCGFPNTLLYVETSRES
jgi:hypothetical protein